MDNNYVLAMYDIRSKQQYIFRKGKIKEIVGGSAILRDLFIDYLVPVARDYAKEKGYAGGLYPYDIKENDKNEEFNVADFEKRIKDHENVGELIYDGGGNFICLYEDRKTCEEINKRFSKKIIEKTQTIKVLCSIKEGVDFCNYSKDQEELRKIHDKLEAKNPPVLPSQILPFTQVDASTSFPIYTTIKVNGKDIQVSKDSFAKYEKYEKERKDGKFKDYDLVLDDIANSEDDSLLAVVYIDGNNMGAKIADKVKNGSSYEEAIKELRKFSKDIQKDFIDNPYRRIIECLDEKNEKDNKKRFIVNAGDETNYICKAEDALELVKAYFRDMPDDDSACAGICIFHSHAPYSEAYRIAEECCESGKKLMKDAGINNACFIDFHYCQSGFGIDLETIRENEVSDIISKPWLLRIRNIEDKDKLKEKTYTDFKTVEKMVEELNKISRTNVKSLIDSARNSEAEFEKELNKIIAHSTGEKPNFNEVMLDKEKRRRLIYDIITVYDLWFKKEND